MVVREVRSLNHRGGKSALERYFTEYVDGGRRLRVAEGERRHLAGVGAHVGEAHPLQEDGGVVHRRRQEGDALGVLLGDGDPELGVEHGYRDGARGKVALPGALCEVGAHLYPASQRDVFAQHRVHFLGNDHLVGACACGERERER